MAARRHTLGLRCIGRISLALRLPLGMVLRPAHVCGNLLENLTSMSEQRDLVWVVRRRRLLTRKRHPIRQDGFEVVADELGQAHQPVSVVERRYAADSNRTIASPTDSARHAGNIQWSRFIGDSARLLLAG